MRISARSCTMVHFRHDDLEEANGYLSLYGQTFCFALCLARDSLLTHLPASNFPVSRLLNRKHLANPPLPRSFPRAYRRIATLPAASIRRSSTTSGTTNPLDDEVVELCCWCVPEVGTGAAIGAGIAADLIAVAAMIAPSTNKKHANTQGSTNVNAREE